MRNPGKKKNNTKLRSSRSERLLWKRMYAKPFDSSVWSIWHFQNCICRSSKYLSKWIIESKATGDIVVLPFRPFQKAPNQTFSFFMVFFSDKIRHKCWTQQQNESHKWLPVERNEKAGQWSRGMVSFHPVGLLSKVWSGRGNGSGTKLSCSVIISV